MLHIINQSPTRTHQLQSCLRILQPQHAVLLIEDGVYAAKKDMQSTNLIKQALSITNVYALQADIGARGLQNSDLLSNIKRIDYTGFVDLTVNYKAIHTWH